jgi:hypothetical protein
MPNGNSKPWRTHVARALVHLGTARLLLDLAIDSEVEEPTVSKLRSIEAEVHGAQDSVRQAAEVA